MVLPYKGKKCSKADGGERLGMFVVVVDVGVVDEYLCGLCVGDYNFHKL